MHRYILPLFILLVSAHLLKAQDADLYMKPPNSRFQMPQVPENMTLQEFQLLSRAVRVKDMAFAMVVPGYVHFRAQEPGWGYSLLGARVAGYTGYGIIAIDPELSFRDVLEWNISLNEEELSQKTTAYQWVLGISTTLIVGSYLTDVIGGHVQLVNKQERIRYKYSMQMLQTRQPENPFVPGFSMKIRF